MASKWFNFQDRLRSAYPGDIVTAENGDILIQTKKLNTINNDFYDLTIYTKKRNQRVSIDKVDGISSVFQITNSILNTQK